jgi:hypothetical protein
MKRVTGALFVAWALVAAAGAVYSQQPAPVPPDERPEEGAPAPPATRDQNPAQPQEKQTAMIDCKMTFNLKGWSAVYKTASGDGVITCDNGEERRVTLNVKGGGLTFGKTSVVAGTGRFTKVKDVQQLFGSYAAGAAHAGAGKSASAQALTKGKVSLTLVGTGEGTNLGLDVSKFTIKPAEQPKQNKKEKKAKETQTSS